MVEVKPNQEKYILPGILLLALGLRLHFLGFLYPYFEFNDEIDLVKSALSILRTGDLNPHFFFYGSFPIYWSAFLFLLALFPSWLLSGSGVSFHSFLAGFDYHQGGMFLFYLGRLTSVLFGVGSVYLIFLVGKELFDRRSGSLAALLLAICPFHIYFSQLFKVDSSFLFWFLLMVYFSLRIYRRGGWKNYLLAGIFFGLGLSTRYNFVAFLPILVAALSREGWRGMIKPGVWIAAYAGTAVFFLSSPYALLDLPAFLEQLRIQMTVDQQTVTFFRTDPSRLFYYQYVYQLIFIFPAFFGPLIYLAAFPGFKGLWNQDRRLFPILASYPVIFFVFFSGYSKLVMPQYQIPILPFVFLGGSGWIVSLIAQRKNWKKKLGVMVLGLSLLFSLSDLVIPHFKEVYYVYRDAARWIDRNIPKESKVLSYTWVYSVTEKFGFQRYQQLHAASDFSYQDDFIKFDPDFLILTELAIFRDSRFIFLYHQYLKLLAELDAGRLKDKYRLVRVFKPNPLWEWGAGKIYPDLQGFRIYVYGKI